MKSDTTESRFWRKVQKTEACWLWTAGMSVGGYGRFKANGRMNFAHRFAYELLVGPIPDGLQLDHLCRVRHCVNPAHLEPVTARENTMRGESFAAVHGVKDACESGHTFDDANTYQRPGGGRACRACRREATRAYRSRKEDA